MQGVPLTPPNHDNRRTEQLCADCGRRFQPRAVGEGAEEVCDSCYDAQFEPPRLRHWQKPTGRTHPMR